MVVGPVSVRHAELIAYRDEFPLLSSCTYLNTCSLGALSVRSRQRLEVFLGQWDRLGARAWYKHWLDELAGLREDFGWAIGRPGAEIALAPNVSVALGAIASALEPVHRGDPAALGRLRDIGLPAGERPRTRVITTELDFPTDGHQWLARAPLGVEVAVLPSPDRLSVPLDAFAAAVDERTALVVTGQVYFTTGAVQDLPALARICHAAGALLVTDAYQSTGLLPTDALALGVDGYVSGTLKWLFGGPGNAFLWLRPEIAAALEPTTTGWFSSARQFAFDVTSLEFAPDGRKWEAGTPAVPSAAIARGGLELVREIGIERLHQRTLDLGAYTIRAAEAAGLRVRAVRDDEQRGGIVAVEVAQPKPVVDALAARGIITDFRPGLVRLSPAFYNTEQEVEEVVAALEELVPSADRAA
ncbi:MAG TPA: aminotransferase class V-fold PLP-dependent enzyme [Candidatus Limnocylindrales bacterium]|nr:aminotransferase class V-fold PLP-dependent enzyme [Candidatus Limnocylindrales bacterium]